MHNLQIPYTTFQDKEINILPFIITESQRLECNILEDEITNDTGQVALMAILLKIDACNRAGVRYISANFNYDYTSC